MIRPDRCRNGSGIENLLELKRAEMEAIAAAIKALQENYPNGRDYQLAGTARMSASAHADACVEHQRRVGWLLELLATLQNEAEYILDGEVPA